MKILLIFSFIIVFSTVCKFSCQDINQTSITKSIVDTIRKLLSEANNSTFIFSDICRSNLKDPNNDTLQLMYKGSSKKSNDVMSYSECMSNNPSISDPVFQYYILTVINATAQNKSLIDPNYKIFGLCISLNCTDDDYKSLLLYIKENRSEIFDLKDSTHSFFQVNKDSFKSTDLLKYIPLMILLIQLTFTMFTVLPYYFYLKLYEIFSCSCCKKKYNNDNYENNEGYKKSFSQLKKAFSFFENNEELILTKKTDSKNIEESGVAYIKGIRGISMILYILGFVFLVIIQSPSHTHSDISLKYFLLNPLSSIVLNGLRYAPRVLLSCSGFLLQFKLTCFLDERIEEKDEYEEQEIPEKIDSMNDLSNNEKRDNEDIEFKTYEVRWGLLWEFMKYQLYKYFLSILVVLFVKYTLYLLLLFFTDVSPLWKFFSVNLLEKSSTLDVVLQLLLIRPFLFYSFKEPEFNKGLLLDYFWLPFNEMIIFLLSSVLLFLCYKYRLSVKNFAITITTISFIFRVAIIFINEDSYSASQFFSTRNYGKFFISPLYNFSFYLIGAHFGLINYCVQKELTFESKDLEATDKEDWDYISGPVFKVQYYTKKSKLFIFILSSFFMLMVVLLSCSHYIFLGSYKDGDQFKFASGAGPKYFYIFDIELVVYLIHWSTMGFYIKGDNGIITLLTSSFWASLNKMYYSFILVLPIVSLVFFYQSDSRIDISSNAIFFYSIIVLILCYVVSSLICIIFELPYKKLTKIWMNADREE